VFGDISLADLRRADVRDWVKTLGCGKKRISNLISPLRTALDDAVDDAYIDANPLAGWSYNKKEPSKKKYINPFTEEEQRLLLTAMDGQTRNLFQFAFWTGLRTSELVALSWSDIDLTKGEVYVAKAFILAAIEEEETKTISGDRIVKLLPPAREAIIRQKSFTFLEGGNVFHHPKYKVAFTGDKQIRETFWRPAIMKSGVRYRNPYQTRHT
jgi:integrase